MKTHNVHNATRRQVLQWAGAGAAALAVGGSARAGELPLKNTGLEHFGMTVPNPEEAARFYGKIFDPQLFQEREPPPRFYVKVGTGYLAFGGNANSMPLIDHWCALTEGYPQGEPRRLFEAAGIKMGNGPLGMATDPDGLRFQTLNVPGGLARSIVPAFRVTQEEPLFQAIAFEYMVLRVTDIEKSVEHYRKIFGKEVSRSAKPDRASFAVAQTRLMLEPVASGDKPSIFALGVRVAGFDRKLAGEKLKKVGLETQPGLAKNSVRFRDQYGFVFDLKGDA